MRNPHSPTIFSLSPLAGPVIDQFPIFPILQQSQSIEQEQNNARATIISAFPAARAAAIAARATPANALFV